MFSAWKADVVHIFPSRNLISNLGDGTDATHTNFQSPLASLRRESINNYEITLPVEVDSQIDEATFYFRFLESLSNVWWLEQAMDATKLPGWSRWHIAQARAEIPITFDAASTNTGDPENVGEPFEGPLPSAMGAAPWASSIFVP